MSDLPALKQRVEELEAASQAADLWEQRGRAQAVLQQLTRLRSEVAQLERFCAQLEDLAVAVELLEMEVSLPARVLQLPWVASRGGDSVPVLHQNKPPLHWNKPPQLMFADRHLLTCLTIQAGRGGCCGGGDRGCCHLRQPGGIARAVGGQAAAGRTLRRQRGGADNPGGCWDSAWNPSEWAGLLDLATVGVGGSSGCCGCMRIMHL